jgi:hypothetical protein
LFRVGVIPTAFKGEILGFIQDDILTVVIIRYPYGVSGDGEIKGILYR